MKYYSISKSGDEKVVGVYPQCKGIPEGMTYKFYDSPESFSELDNETLPSSEVQFLWELENKAIQTDVISPSNLSADGLLISERFRNLLLEFNLGESKIFEATVIIDGTVHKYFWLHCFEKDPKTKIDFKKSQFHVCGLSFKHEYDIEINSRKEYEDEFSKLGLKHIFAKKLVLNKFEEMDLLYLPLISARSILFSEKLIEAIEMNYISGMNFKEAGFISF